METGFAIVAFLTLILNLVLPEVNEDEETPELTANHADDAADEEEWRRIQKTKEMDSGSGEGAVNKAG